MKLLLYLYTQNMEMEIHTHMLDGMIWGNRETTKRIVERRTSKKVHLTETKRTFVCYVVQKSLCVLFFWSFSLSFGIWDI